MERPYRFSHLVSSVAFIAFGAACTGASSDGPASPAPASPACAEGEVASADGSCTMQSSPASCPGGTRPAVGTTECLPVGPTSCAEGFAKDPSGFGCAPVLAADECKGATRPKLGATSCVPVGDCTEAFPPANAILVDPATTVVDATHVKTIAEAVAVAETGATIALADGTHTTETLSLKKSVSLVGRCAEKARVVPASNAPSSLEVRAGLALRGVTLVSLTTPLSVVGSIEVTVDDVVIEGARTRAIFAERGSDVRVRGSVIRGTSPASGSEQTVGVLAGTGSHVRVEESAIVGSVDAAVVATDSTDTHIEVVRSAILDTKARPDNKGGSALRAFEGAKLELLESAVLRSRGIAILTFRRNKPAPTVIVRRSVLGNTTSSTETGNAIGMAVNAAYEATVTIEESTIADTEGTGLYVAEKARADVKKSVILRTSRTPDFSAHGASALKEGVIALEDSAIVRAGGLGLGGWERGRATLTRSLVRDIGGDILEGLPAGQGLNVHSGSTIDANDSAIVDTAVIAASAIKPGSSVHLDRVLVTRTDDAPPTEFGHGFLSMDTARVDATHSIVERLPGVALFYASGAGAISASVVRDNAVAVHVQEGSTLAEMPAVPEAIGEAELVIASNVRFANNASRLGSGVLPLPGVLAAP